MVDEVIKPRVIPEFSGPPVTNNGRPMGTKLAREVRWGAQARENTLPPGFW